MARKKQSVRAAERAQELQKKRKAQEDARAAKRRRLEQGGLDEPPAVPEPPAGWATCQRFADPPAAVTERLSKMLGDELCFDQYAAWDPASLRLLAKAGASKTKAVAEAAVSAARAKEEGRRSSPQSVRRTVEAIFKNAQHVSGASTLQKQFLDALVNPKWKRPWDAALGAALLSYAAGAEVTEEEVNAHATLTGGALVVTNMCHEIAFEAVSASRDAFSLSGYNFGESEFKEDWAKADWDSREDSDDGLNKRVRPHHVFNAVRQEDVLRAIFLPGLCSGEGAEESKEGEAKADVEATAFSRHLELESVPGLRKWAKKMLVEVEKFPFYEFRKMVEKGTAPKVFTYLCAACAPQLTVLECEEALDNIANLIGVVEDGWTPGEIFPDKQTAAQFTEALSGLGRSALLREELAKQKTKLLGSFA